MFNYKRCNACRKYKFGVKERRIYIQSLKIGAKSKNEICKNCAKLYQSIK